MFLTSLGRLFPRTARARTSRRPAPKPVRPRCRPRLEALEERNLLSVITWAAPVSGDWNTASNWVGGVVPTATDTAVIPFANITVTHDTATANAVQRLVSEAAVNVSDGSLTVGNATTSAQTTSRLDNTLSVTGAGAVTLQNLTLSGTGTVQNSATLDATASFLNVAVQNNAGVLTSSGATFNSGTPFVNAAGATLADGVGATFATGFTNQGTITLGVAGHGTVDLNVLNGTLVNAPVATVTFVVIDAEAAPSSINGNFTNQGTVNGQGSANLGQAGDTVSNSGTINVNNIFGEGLSVTGASFTNTGTLSIGSGLGLTVSGGTFTEDGTQTGAGRLTLLGTTADFTGNVSTAATPLAIENSTFNDSTGTLTNNGTLDITGSTINAPLVNDGTLTAQGSTATLDGAFSNAAGATVTVTGPATLDVAQGFTNQGTITLTNGFGVPTLTVSSGTLTNAAGATIQSTGTNTGSATLDAALINQGTLTVDEGLVVNGTVTSSGAVNVQTGDLTLNLTGTLPTFANSGTVTVSTLQGLNVNGGGLTNSGTVSLGSVGTVKVSGGYTQSAGSTKLGGGILTVGTAASIDGGALTGPGTVNGNLVNAALVDAGAAGKPGTLNVEGNYTQTSAGTLQVQVKGTGAGSGFDQLNVSGVATLAGTLSVKLLGGFVPQAGQAFPVATFASESGAFTTLKGAADFTVQDNATNVTLVGK